MQCLPARMVLGVNMQCENSETDRRAAKVHLVLMSAEAFSLQVQQSGLTLFRCLLVILATKGATAGIEAMRT